MQKQLFYFSKQFPSGWDALAAAFSALLTGDFETGISNWKWLISVYFQSCCYYQQNL